MKDLVSPFPPSGPVPSPSAVRVRSHDEMVPAHETKRRLKACRQTIEIGSTIFRCDAPISLPPTHQHQHHEKGLIKRRDHPDFEYEITWYQVEKRVIRTIP